MSKRLRQKLAKTKVWLLSIAWLICHYHKFKQYLKCNKFDIVNLKPIMLSSWHRGSRYFKGILSDGQKVFIKTDGIYRLVRREIEACRIIMEKTQGVKHVPVVRFYDLNGRYPFVAFEWVKGKTLEVVMRKKTPQVSFETLTNDLLTILDILRTTNIIHRDLTPANLLVSFDDYGQPKRLWMIDFSFVVIDNRAEIDRRIPSHELNVLCSGFKPSAFVWDDAYSCLKIAELMERSMAQSFDSVIRSIERRVGQLIYRHANGRKC